MRKYAKIDTKRSLIITIWCIFLWIFIGILKEWQKSARKGITFWWKFSWIFLMAAGK
jgi:hypothetical protein